MIVFVGEKRSRLIDAKQQASSQRDREDIRSGQVAASHGATLEWWSMTQEDADEHVSMLKEVRRQCASCPFREGNDRELGDFLVGARICSRSNSRKRVKAIREEVKRDTLANDGGFSCHHSAYTKDGEDRPERSHRQCKGASKFFVEYLKSLPAEADA